MVFIFNFFQAIDLWFKRNEYTCKRLYARTCTTIKMHKVEYRAQQLLCKFVFILTFVYIRTFDSDLLKATCIVIDIYIR